MTNATQHPFHSLQSRFQKVCRQLQHLGRQGKSASLRKWQSLQKRRDKYLQQLLSIGSPLLKGGAFALAMCLSAQTKAQRISCLHYHDADSANPLIQPLLIKGYNFPFFVDIDGDGDADCYMQDPDGSVKRPVFFENQGTNTIPYFKLMNSKGGFQNFTDPVPNDYVSSNAVFADLDGDGDMDCFIPEGHRSYFGVFDYHVVYYENKGTKTKPDFVENDAANPLLFVKGSNGLTLDIADIDGDGDYDVFATDMYNYNLYLNVGTKTSASFTYAYNIQNSYGSGGLFHRLYYDWNKDGLMDYTQFGTYYRNIAPAGTIPSYVVDANGPKFGPGEYLQQTLSDLNGDDMPELFLLTGNMLTNVPVPVIGATRSGSKTTRLSATPKDDGLAYQWQRNGKIFPVLPGIAFLPAFRDITPLKLQISAAQVFPKCMQSILLHRHLTKLMLLQLC